MRAIHVQDERGDAPAMICAAALAHLCNELERQFGKIAMLDGLISAYLNLALEHKGADEVKKWLREMADTDVDKIDRQRRAMMS